MKNRFLHLVFFLMVPGIFLTGQRVTIDFEEYAAGITLSNQLSLSSQGISFPEGLQIVDCQFSNWCDAGSGGAQSGNRLGIGSPYDEFVRNAINIVFEERQDSVTLYLKPGNNLNMQLTYKGFTNGTIFATSGGTDNLNNNGFRRYKFVNCDQIWINSRSEGQELDDNWIIIDDINFLPSDHVPEDRTRPSVYVTFPSNGYTSSTGFLRVRGNTIDDVQLDTVEVIVSQGDEVVHMLNFCGRAGSACPIGSSNYHFDTELDLRELENGDYWLKLRSVDASGNESFQHINFTINIQAPPEVRVEKVEINQVVHDQLFEVFGPGIANSVFSGVPLLPERNTLIRYYLSTEENVRYNYTGRLKLVVYDTDGGEITEFIDPNVIGFSDVDSISPFPAGALEEAIQLADMRSKMERTLNFVIDKNLLINASTISLTLFQGSIPISGQLQTNFSAATEFGISYYRIRPSTPTPGVFMDNISPFAEALLPVSRLHDRYEGEILIRPRARIIVLRSEASRFRRSLNSALYMRWPAIFYTPEYEHWRVILGIMNPNAGGNATRGDAGNFFDRYFGVAVSSSRGDVATHESGHLIGLQHAGSAHGECGGGGCEEFVNINGTLDGESLHLSDFGIALQLDSATNMFNAFLIDPCPVTDPLNRYDGCTAGILDTDPEPVRPFDIMSYGEPNPYPGLWLDARSRQWISTHNYRRLYNAIQGRINLSKSAETLNVEEAQMQMYFQVDGIISDDSSFMHGLIEKPMDKNMVENMGDKDGDYSLYLLDINGQVLSEKEFSADSLLDTEECCPLTFNVAVPKVEGVHEIVVKNKDGITIIQKTASLHSPSIDLISKLGGESFSEGKILLSWKLWDPDNDPLILNVEYSPDFGKTWVPLAYLEEPEESDIEIDVAHLPASDSAVIRLSASDGIHTAVDINSETFCVKSEGSCNFVSVDLNDLGLAVSTRDFERAKTLNHFELYPNPAQGYVNINLEMAKAGKIGLKLINVLGKEVKVIADYSASSGKNIIRLETNDLSEGVYYIRVDLENESLTKKLVIN